VGLLLDTHVWVWTQEAPENFGVSARARLLDPTQSLHVATISTLELARLHAHGRIGLAGSLRDWVDASLDLLTCDTVELSHSIAIEAYALPEPFHRDPADRILVATARVLGLTLLTADRRILDYPHVDTLDARA
jgi:PIN domain nuclease of toxin-antitoxin system